MKAIEINNLTKTYGKARGITNLSLTVEEGSFFGFIGPNGAGKSTTIRSLLGLLRPTSGSCSIFGTDCWTAPQSVHTRLGYLPSENAFYPGMRVKDVLKLSADLRGKNCRKEAGDLIERLQLDTEKKVTELSFGNRKKLAIICALQHDPELLILDEPTGGLDPLMQKAFFDILRERHQAGRTIFFSSHILTEVQENCDRIAVIRNGRLAACDTRENLIPNHIKKVLCKSDAAPSDLPALSGIRNAAKTGDCLSFIYDGEVTPLLEQLAALKPQDVHISEPDLEEIFMHYYEEVDHDALHA